MNFEWVGLVVPLMQLFSFAEVELKRSSSIIYNIPCEMNRSYCAFVEVKSKNTYQSYLLFP